MNILILDDSTTMQKIMGNSITMFFEDNVKVRELSRIHKKDIKLQNLFFASNAQDAYDILTKNNIDLLIQDTNRTGEAIGNEPNEAAGFLFLDKLRRDKTFNNLKIVINTVNKYDFDLFNNRGIDGYFMKLNTGTGLSSPHYLLEILGKSFLEGEEKIQYLRQNSIDIEAHNENEDKPKGLRKNHSAAEVTAILKERWTEKYGHLE